MSTLEGRGNYDLYGKRIAVAGKICYAIQGVNGETGLLQFLCGSVDLNSKPMVAIGKSWIAYLWVQGVSGETGRNPMFTKWKRWSELVHGRYKEEGTSSFWVQGASGETGQNFAADVLLVGVPEFGKILGRVQLSFAIQPQI